MVKKSLILALSCAGLLSACADSYRSVNVEQLKYDGQYWQRADVTEATYMEGPKAQQMLHRDIARCTTELRELERLGDIRNAIPADSRVEANTPEGRLAQWETPERDAYLLAEHGNYDDFETCMQAKGWERMEHVPYDLAKKAREDYLEAMTGQRYQTRNGTPARTGTAAEPPLEQGPKAYSNLNQ